MRNTERSTEVLLVGLIGKHQLPCPNASIVFYLKQNVRFGLKNVVSREKLGLGMELSSKTEKNTALKCERIGDTDNIQTEKRNILDSYTINRIAAHWEGRKLWVCDTTEKSVFDSLAVILPYSGPECEFSGEHFENE